MLSSTYIISFIQVTSDLACVIFSGLLAFKYKRQKQFYSLNFLSFVALAFADIYYNYNFRFLKLNILLSGEFISVAPLMIFQILQLYNWYKLSSQQKVKIFSWLTLPYLLFCFATTVVIAYFFFTTERISVLSTIEDLLSVALNISVWFFAIVCFGRAKSNAVVLMSLGSMMIVSASLTMTCLFRFDMNNIEVTEWPHAIWAAGIFLMAIGHIYPRKNNDFEFFGQNSMHAHCNWWLLMSTLIVFIMGFGFAFFFNGAKGVNEIHYVLWNVPASLMFAMIVSSVLSNRFSNVILSPINSFSQSIESFNMGEKYEIKVNSAIKEFKILEEFIEKSFTRISDQLDHEIKVSAQVAHDIRSPLAALQVGVDFLPSDFNESNRILLRDAVQNMRDIINSLDKKNIHKLNDKKQLTQIAVVLDSVISERRIALSRENVKFKQNYNYTSYAYFAEIVPSILKRIVVNLLNNAYEAISGKGEINIYLREDNRFCVIDIIDNGCGISDKNFKFLFERGFTTKKMGSGLGVHHARESLLQWGATIDIFSMEGKGTEVSIKIPLSGRPSWFVSKLELLENEMVVCVDDNQSVYQSWKERFKFYGYRNRLIYCSSKDSFISELKEIGSKPAVYLIDFEFSGKIYNGCDLSEILIKNKNISSRIFFVTSHSGEKEIQDYCFANSIRIIPKNIVDKIPIEILS